MNEISKIQSMLDRVAAYNSVDDKSLDLYVICPHCNGDTFIKAGVGYPYTPLKTLPCPNCVDGKVKLSIQIKRESGNTSGLGIDYVKCY
jgi:hypothetical protein